MKSTLAFLLAAAAPAVLHAQNTAVSTSGELWKGITAYITTAAEELTPAQYAFRPTEKVRTFGELVAHVAGAQNLICAAALGDPPRAEDEFEKPGATKAQLVAALKASTAYCAKAYAQTDAAAQQSTSLFGQQRTRLYALVLNATHNGEHYGNMINYLRIQGLVPPSSRQP